VESHVIARVRENEDQFETHNVHLQSEASAVRRLKDSALEQLRLRRYPGFLVERGRQIAPDIIHAHFGSWGWSVLNAADRIGAPLVVTFYGFDVNQLPRAVPKFRRRYRDLFARAAGIFCEGEHMRESLLKLGCPPQKAFVQRLGVDLDGIPFQPRSIDPGAPVRVLIASAFREKKGIPLAIRALGQLKDDHSFSITLLGDASELEASQREKRKIEEAIRDSGLSESVHRVGFQPHAEMLRMAGEHDVFLAPSHEAPDGDTEGGAPVVLVEMAASGVPIVTSDHCDIPGIVSDGITGIVAKEADEEDLARALRRAFRLGSGWRPITEAARQHVITNFDARTQGLALAELYRRVIREAPSQRS
jgi:colanic acid/amylovoran biosynthesis glycosyltransferase